MRRAGSEIAPLGITHTIRQYRHFRGEQILRVRKIECHVQVLRPREMQLDIVVEFRREFGVSFLITIRIDVRAEGIEYGTELLLEKQEPLRLS